jgi:hypothetical protein
VSPYHFWCVSNLAAEEAAAEEEAVEAAAAAARGGRAAAPKRKVSFGAEMSPAKVWWCSGGGVAGRRR